MAAVSDHRDFERHVWTSHVYPPSAACSRDAAMDMPSAVSVLGVLLRLLCIQHAGTMDTRHHDTCF